MWTTEPLCVDSTFFEKYQPINKHHDFIGRLELSFQAGILFRKKIKSKLETISLENGLKFDLEEDKNLLKSEFSVTLEGPIKTLNDVKNIIDNWIKNNTIK